MKKTLKTVLLLGPLCIFMIVSCFKIMAQAGPASVTGTNSKEAQRYLNPVFKDLTITRDVVYAQKKDLQGQKVDLALDIYEPKGDSSSNRAAIIWIHGGGFTSGDKGGGTLIRRTSAAPVKTGS